MAEEQQKKELKGIWQNYEVSGDTLKRKNTFSPKAGKGYFMAKHKDRSTCGHSGYTEFPSGEKTEGEAKPDSKDEAKEAKEEKAESKEESKEESKPEAKEEKSEAREEEKN
jgi:ribosomal protein S27AE